MLNNYSIFLLLNILFTNSNLTLDKKYKSTILSKYKQDLSTSFDDAKLIDNAIVQDPHDIPRYFTPESNLQQKLSNKITLTSDLKATEFSPKDRNPFELYQNLHSNNSEVQFVLSDSPAKPIKVINLLTINGKKLRSDVQPKEIDTNHELLVKKMLKVSHFFRFCKQENKSQSTFNNGYASEIDYCYFNTPNTPCKSYLHNQVSTSQIYKNACQLNSGNLTKYKRGGQYYYWQKEHCQLYFKEEEKEEAPNVEDIEKARCTTSMKLYKCNIDWNLYRNGTDWDCECRNGTRQSPIDLPDYRELYGYYKDKTKEMITTVPEVNQCLVKQCTDDYSSIVAMLNSVSAWNMEYTTYNYNGSYIPITGRTISIVPNDKSISSINIDSLNRNKMINYGFGVYYYYFSSMMKLSEGKYEYKFISNNLSIKSPSEHSINGVLKDLELQILFKLDPNAEHKYSSNYIMISFLFTEDKNENLFLNNLIGSNKLLYSEAGYSFELEIPIDYTELFGNGVKSDMFSLDSYYMYNGSFTIPDCTEDVVWIVYDKELSASLKQIKLLRQLQNWNYDKLGNNRVVQNPNGRNIWYKNKSFEFVRKYQKQSYNYTDWN